MLRAKSGINVRFEAASLVFYACLLLFFSPSVLFAAPPNVSIEASVDRDVVQIGDRVVLSISIQAQGGGEIQVGNIQSPGFNQLQTSDRYGFSYGTGRQPVTQKSRQVVLQATQGGVFQLGPISVWIDGVAYESEAVTVTVGGGQSPMAPATPRGSPLAPIITGSGANNQAPPPRVPQQTPSNQPFFTTSAGETEVYRGQQFLLDYEAYAPQTRPWSVTSIDQPSFEGFWFANVDTNATSYVRRSATVGSVPFQSTLLSRYVMIPLEEGRLIIPAQSGQMASLWIGAVPLSSEPAAITVKPLPEGAPPGFSANNIGQYEFTVSASTETVRVGDPVLVTMRVEGFGLAGLVEIPRIIVEGAVQIQPPIASSEQELQRGGLDVGGYSVHEYAVLPTEEGEVSIGPMTFHYFDPKLGQYLSSTAEEIHVSVSGVRPGSPVMEEEHEEDMSQFLSALPPVQAVTSPLEEVPIRPWLFWALLFSPPIFWLSLLFAGRVMHWQTGRQPALELKGARATAKRDIMRYSDGPEGKALEGIYGALSQYIKVRLGVSSAAFTAENLCEEIVNRGLSRPLSDSIVALFKTIENERFSGTETNRSFVSDVSSQALGLLDEMEAQF